MKRIALVLGILVLILVAMPGNVWADGTYSGGDGSKESPYQISTTEDLIELSNTSADWGAYFIQTADISFNSDETSVDWDGDGQLEHGTDEDDTDGFSPIGNSSNKFTGSYDGGGHTIDNLFINRPSTDYVGLFGYTSVHSSVAPITDIGVTNVDITGKDHVGALVGLSNSDNSISNTYSTGSVSGNWYVGGLIGYNNSPLDSSYSTASVSGSGDEVGGLVGTNSNNSISNSYSTGSVSSSGQSVGGLVGENQSEVSNCYSTSSVVHTDADNSYPNVGGLVGQHYDGGTINNCYSTGNVEGNDTKNRVGGLVGVIFGDSDVTDSFWDTQTSGQSSSDGGTGKTTSEMKDYNTFTDTSTVGLDNAWDFPGNLNDDAGNEDIWNIHSSENDGYPYNYYEEEEGGPLPPVPELPTLLLLSAGLLTLGGYLVLRKRKGFPSPQKA